MHQCWVAGMVIVFGFCAAAQATDEVYQQPSAFIAESFNATPTKRTLTITDGVRARISKIMGTHYQLSAPNYWEHEGKTAWVLEEIGKYKPITTGIVVGKDGTLARLKVLIYRESHGGEVRHSFFTRQFKGAGLRRGKKLDQPIDGIAGATLSVKALERLSALALMLHEEVSKNL